MKSSPSLAQWASQFQPYTLALLRTVAALLYWEHGAWKLFGWFGGHAVPAYGLFWFGGVIEVICAPLLFVGLLTRPIAVLLCGEMAVAYLTQHLPHGWSPIQNEGLVPLQYLMIFLLLSTRGPGAFSIDALLRADRQQETNRFSRLLNQFYPVALTVARILAAFLFWQFAARKMFGWFGGRVAKFGTRLWVAGAMEAIGAPLIAVGLFTRALAFWFCGEMAVAFWTSHAPRGHFWPIQNGGEPAVLFCFIFLFLATAGPGRLSIDGLLNRAL